MGGNIPDLRGLFLRGYGSQSYSQNNGSTIGVTSTFYESGLLGGIQGDAIRNITGYFAGGRTGMIMPDSVKIGGAFYALSQFNNGNAPGNGTYHNVGFDISRVVPTTIENRPVNMSVRYLIRALP